MKNHRLPSYAACCLLLATVLPAFTQQSDEAALEELRSLTSPKSLKVKTRTDGTVTSISPGNIPRGKEAQVLQLLRESFPEIEEMRINFSEEDGTWVESLAGKEKLRKLIIGGHVGNEFLQALASLEQLPELDLQATYSTDAGFRSLSEMDQLEWLSIRVRRPHVSDQFLDGIRGLDQLKEFRLTQMVIQDPASLVAFVEAHPSLQRVTLGEVHSQHDLVGAIKAVRPDLEVSLTPMRYIAWIKWFDWPYGDQ